MQLVYLVRDSMRERIRSVGMPAPRPRVPRGCLDVQPAERTIGPGQCLDCPLKTLSGWFPLRRATRRCSRLRVRV